MTARFYEKVGTEHSFCQRPPFAYELGCKKSALSLLFQQSVCALIERTYKKINPQPVRDLGHPPIRLPRLSLPRGHISNTA